MAVTVTDTRTVINNANDETGWLGVSDEQGNMSVIASGVTYVEGGVSIIGTLNIARGILYFTSTTSFDLSDTLIYVWSNNLAFHGNWDDPRPPNALLIGDGTNRVSFKMAGSNKKVFTHLQSDDGVTSDWDCLVLDGSIAVDLHSRNLAVDWDGSFGNLNLNAITEFGSDFTTLSKGIGGGFNVAVDIIRIGNNGLIVTGGSDTDKGKFIEIVNIDRSTEANRAFGIIRELNTGLYTLQGPLTFGNSNTPEDSWFHDENRVITFEDRDIGDDKYYLRVAGHPNSQNHFSLNSCIINSAGPWVGLDFSSSHLDTLELNNMTISNLGNRDIVFSSDPNTLHYSLERSNIQGCGTLLTGSARISNTVLSLQTADYLINMTTNSNNWENVTLIGNGEGPNYTHGILIETPGTYTFNNILFEDFGANETISAAIHNNSGSHVVIDVIGGNTPTVRNTNGSTTTVNNSIQLTIENIIENSELRIYRQSDLEEMGGVENISTVPTDANNVVVLPDLENVGRYKVLFNYNYEENLSIFLVVFKETQIPIYQPLTLGNSDSSFIINQIFDRQYES